MLTPKQDYTDHEKSNTTSLKGANKVPITNLKEVKINDLLENRFKTVFLKKLNEVQEDIDRETICEKMRNLIKKQTI